MKIGFLTQQYPHQKTGTSGGIGTAIKNLAAALTLAGHQAVILIYEQPQDAVFEDAGVVFYQIKNVKSKIGSGYFTRKKIEKLINRLHGDGIIDIVEAPDWTGISSFIRPECPLVIRENGSDTYFCHLEKRKSKRKNRFHEKTALQNADGIMAVSQFTGDVTNEVFNLKRKFTVIPNSIDLPAFPVNEGVAQEKVILYFGNLIRKKGALELPLIFNEVFKSHPDVKLQLVGKDIVDIQTGTQSTWALMQPLFDAAALKNVQYFGGVDYEKVFEFIKNADVCVFPSFAEAFPVSWLEAMALEKAIVASDIGWADEMLEDGVNGFLVNPKAHLLFAERIKMLLEDKKKNAGFGKKAREKVETAFSSAVIARKSIAFYEKIIQSKK